MPAIRCVHRQIVSCGNDGCNKCRQTELIDEEEMLREKKRHELEAHAEMSTSHSAAG